MLPYPASLSLESRQCHSGLHIGSFGRWPALLPAVWEWRAAAHCCLYGRPDNEQTSGQKHTNIIKNLKPSSIRTTESHFNMFERGYFLFLFKSTTHTPSSYSSWRWTSVCRWSSPAWPWWPCWRHPPTHSPSNASWHEPPPCGSWTQYVGLW